MAEALTTYDTREAILEETSVEIDERLREMVEFNELVDRIQTMLSPEEIKELEAEAEDKDFGSRDEDGMRIPKKKK